MNKKQTFKSGRFQAMEANHYGQFTKEELANEDKFREAMHQILENQRQFSGHPTYDIANEPNQETLYEGFEDGENSGVEFAVRKRFKRNGEPR
jgi:hypothetical protein